MVDERKSDTTTKPFVLVLCATLKTCLNVASAFNQVAQYEKNIKCCHFISGIPDKDLMVHHFR